jgi:hypothetical protein
MDREISSGTIRHQPQTGTAGMVADNIMAEPVKQTGDQ